MKLSGKSIAAIGIMAAAGVTGIVYWRSAPRRAITARYGELDAAIAHKDLRAYMLLLTPDYTEIRLNQKEKNREQSEQLYGQLMADWSGYRAEPVEVDAFNANRRAAIALVKRANSGLMLDRKGVFGAKGASHRMKIVNTEIDLWLSADSGWLLKRRTISLAMITVDGKLLPGGTVHDND